MKKSSKKWLLTSLFTVTFIASLTTLHASKERDKKEVELYQKAAEQRDVKSQITLSRMHEHGEGLKKKTENTPGWNQTFEKLELFLSPLLNETCKMCVPLKQKATWSRDKLLKSFREEFSEEELRGILSYHEEMGGEVFVQKMIFLMSKMTQIMENLKVPNVEKIAFSFEHSSLIDKEMKRKKIGPLLGSAYLTAFWPDINESHFKKATHFKNKALLYLKSICVTQYSLTEQRKTEGFESSSLGKRFSEALGKSFLVTALPGYEIQ